VGEDEHHSNGRRIGTYTIGIAAEDLRYDIIPTTFSGHGA